MESSIFTVPKLKQTLFEYLNYGDFIFAFGPEAFFINTLCTFFDYILLLSSELYCFTNQVVHLETCKSGTLQKHPHPTQQRSRLFDAVKIEFHRLTSGHNKRELECREGGRDESWN